MEQEPLGEQTPNHTLRHTFEMTGYVVRMYRRGIRSNEEARRDAVMVAAALLGWFKVEPFFHPEFNEEDIWENSAEVRKWQQAIEAAKQGDWQAMRGALQGEARSAFDSAAARDFLEEKIVGDAARDAQARGEAFTNLVLSL